MDFLQEPLLAHVNFGFSGTISGTFALGEDWKGPQTSSEVKHG